ncbi:hypothetical protein D3C71_1630740 [compost metagenome]
MRCDDHIRSVEERLRGRGLAINDVEGGTSDHPGVERHGKSCVVHQPASAHIYKQRALCAFRQETCVDHPGRLGVQGRVQDNHICQSSEIIWVDRLRQAAVVASSACHGDDPAPKRLQLACGLRSDPSKTDDADG